ncbi:hypothetical protein M378DRAFT_164590 [Amanita muscaria Koide BX008]|uniref:Uncharacterized protein n=1 Tax=Amanita muscaria (strain Koide BX008) TaxID=946122 RepID=A0A0C2X2B3_AMAMK|nr:hypothetical protein M378DRAFT_164590 [Amanita muscaria Koide BX008]
MMDCHSLEATTKRTNWPSLSNQDRIQRTMGPIKPNFYERFIRSKSRAQIKACAL